MKRIYQDFAYGDGPVAECYWDTTIARPPRQAGPEGDVTHEIAIIGGGFTGLSAALHLARDAGADVAVLEAEGIGWGASGRNGGFASMGGTKASEAALLGRFGTAAMVEWHGAQKAACALVAEIVETYGIDVDAHSREGEICLAHRPRDFAAFREEQPELARAYGVDVDVFSREDLVQMGMAGPEFHGGIRLPIGFALNPLKYVLGLAAAARASGARLYEDAPVNAITRENGRYVLTTPKGRVRAKKLIVATNGYSSEDVPEWMAGRYLPALSAILVTRELTAAEIAAQGWSSDYLAYDSRNLLHYFRLMPNRRFLFGGRGGTSSSAEALAGRHTILRADFERMFPAWAHVETPHFWSGFVCLTRDLTPFAGPIGDWDDAWAGFAWHGNGVALGTWSGKLLAGLATGVCKAPALMAPAPRRFPFGPLRRNLLRPAYAWYGLKDR